MTRARMPRPQEVSAARRDPRLLRAFRDRRTDQSWRTRGVCRSVDPETFFPAPSEPADAAVALCRTCPVQGACLAWALDVGDCHGVWGATTPRERRAMLVAWRDETAPDEMTTGMPALAPVGADPPPALPPAAVLAPTAALAPAASVGLCAMQPVPLPLGMPRRRFEPDEELAAWNHLVETVPV